MSLIKWLVPPVLSLRSSQQKFHFLLLLNFHNLLFTLTRLTFKENQQYPKFSVNSNLNVKHLPKIKLLAVPQDHRKWELSSNHLSYHPPPWPKGIASLLKLLSITLLNPSLFSGPTHWEASDHWSSLYFDTLFFRIPDHPPVTGFCLLNLPLMFLPLLLHL